MAPAEMAEKLLVVDDDPDIRRTIVLLLGADYGVLEACDGAQALALIERERPRLILLDIAMPEMNGLEVLASALVIDSELIVIMLTGEKDIAVAKRALEMGAAEYITKPFDMDYLREEVRRLMEEADEEGGEGDSPPWRKAP